MKAQLAKWNVYVSTVAILLMLLHVVTGRRFNILNTVSLLAMIVWLVLWLWQLWFQKKYQLMAAVFAVFVVGVLLVFVLRLL